MSLFSPSPAVPQRSVACLAALALSLPVSHFAEPRLHGDPLPGGTAVRLLHLRDGGVLRAKTRPIEGGEAGDGGEGGWEVLRDEGWIRLPSAAVVRVALEKDVLAEARVRERELSRGRPPGEPAALALSARSAHCAWLLDEGLAVESLRALDDLLEDAPDEPRARELCLDERLALRLPGLYEPRGGPASLASDARTQARAPVDPARLEELLAQAARGGPVLREQAAASIRTAPPDIERALCAELVHSDPRRRSLGAFLLRRALPGRALEPLLRRSILDGSPLVRREASRALSAADDPRVLGTYVRLLSASDSQTRARSVEALGNMGHGAAVQPLIAYLASIDQPRGGRGSGSVSFGTWTAFVGDFDVEVAQGVAIADPRPMVIGSGASLDATLLSTSSDSPLHESALVREALERLTHERPGRSTRAWTEWWDENGADWTRAHPAPPERSAAANPDGG